LRGIRSDSILFNNGGQLSDWNSSPLFGEPSLEEDIRQGDEREREDAKNKNIPLYHSVKLRNCPVLIVENLQHLRGHYGVSSIASASRFASRCGVRVLQRIEALKELRDIRAQAYEQGDELVLGAFQNLRHKPFQFPGYATSEVTCYVFHWVAGGIADLAVDTGLPASTILTLALAAGLSQSTDVIAEQYLARFARHVVDFASYLEQRVELARRLIIKYIST